MAHDLAGKIYIPPRQDVRKLTERLSETMGAVVLRGTDAGFLEHRFHDEVQAPAREPQSMKPRGKERLLRRGGSRAKPGEEIGPEDGCRGLVQRNGPGRNPLASATAAALETAPGDGNGFPDMAVFADVANVEREEFRGAESCVGPQQEGGLVSQREFFERGQDARFVIKGEGFSSGHARELQDGLSPEGSALGRGRKDARDCPSNVASDPQNRAG